MSDETFLSRWSRKKVESKAATAGPGADSIPVSTGTQLPPSADAALPASEPTPPEPLPPVESLTPDSDFTPFMKNDVEPGLKRQAFKKLIEDPRFNLMDGLDVYIDDYSKPDPLPEGWLEKMNQVKYLGIFKEPEAEPEVAVEAGAEQPPVPLQKAIEEQPLDAAAPAVPPYTSEAEIPPPGVGKGPISGQ